MKAPAYRIIVDGIERTHIFQGRLISLTLRDNRGQEADQLDIEASDHDGKLNLPPKGAVINIAFGWKDELVDKGQFIVDNVEHNGPPDKLTIRAHSANFRAGLKSQKTRSWDKTTLGGLVATIAADHDLTPAVSADLAATAIDHLDQTNESDMHLLTRLGQKYGAIAAFKSGRILFIPEGQGKTASGQAMATLIITRGDGDSHSYQESDRNGRYTGVQANWHDLDQAKEQSFVIGKAGYLKTLRQPYPTPEEAMDAANAEWERINRSGSSMRITLAYGRADIIPETPVRLLGWKAPIDEQAWHTGNVTHTLSDNGFTTSVDLERKQH